MQNTARQRLSAVPAPPDLALRVRVLAEVVDTLLERTEVLEEQRAMLSLKIELLEAPLAAAARS